MSLITSPSYTLDVRNGADAFNLEGSTNGVVFPPSRRKNGNFEQVVFSNFITRRLAFRGLVVKNFEFFRVSISSPGQISIRKG